MKTATSSATVTLWVNRCIAVLLAALSLAMPWLRFGLLSKTGWIAVLAAYYICAPITALALWHMDRLLRNILAGTVFVWENVNRIRCVRWCCLGVSLVCIPAGFFYFPLFVMVVIMAFLSLVVNVVCQVFKAAVAIREENDLTI